MTIPKIPSYPLPGPETWPANKVPWTLDPSRAALLIHDMQDYFVSFYGPSSPIVAQLTESIVSLRRWAKARGVPIFYTAQPTNQDPNDRGLLNDMWGRGLDNHPELKGIVPAIAPDDGDVVLTKWRYSAFQRCDLADRLVALKRDQLVICGVYAHIGCLMTAANAFMLDVKPFLVGDAIADFSADEHMMALRYVATRCGNVLSTREVTVR